MPKILKNDGEELDSAFQITSISGINGLVLESWGPSYRNPDYAKAMVLILSRLAKLGVPRITVYAVSKNLTNAYPNIEDRIMVLPQNLWVDSRTWRPEQLPGQ